MRYISDIDFTVERMNCTHSAKIHDTFNVSKNVESLLNLQQLERAPGSPSFFLCQTIINVTFILGRLAHVFYFC